jgi:hypothetical protein
MMIPRFCSKKLVTLFALLVFAGLANFATLASAQKQSTGGMRAGDAQPLTVTVILNGNAYVDAHVVITASKGAVLASGWTGEDGTFTTNALNVGTFKVTASTQHYTASGSVTLDKLPTNASLALTLAKKPKPSAAPAANPTTPPSK